MARVNNATRQTIIQTIAANVVTEIDFTPKGAQFPNVFQIYNYGSADVFVSVSPTISTIGNYDFNIAAGGIQTVTLPESPAKLYFYSTDDAPIKINAFIGDVVDSSELASTQMTAIINQQMGSNATPTIYTVNMTDANVEYSVTINNVHQFGVAIRGGVSPNLYRLAFESGHVDSLTEPFLQFSQDYVYFMNALNIKSVTLYLSSNIAGVVAQVEVW